MVDDQNLTASQREIAERVKQLREQIKLGFTADGEKFGQAEEKKAQAQIQELFRDYLCQRSRDLSAVISVDGNKGRPRDGQVTSDEVLELTAAYAVAKKNLNNNLSFEEFEAKIKGLTKYAMKDPEVMAEAKARFEDLQKRVPDKNSSDGIIKLSEAARIDVDFIKANFHDELAALKNEEPEEQKNPKNKPPKLTRDQSIYAFICQVAERGERNGR
jgi:hypothetical protein